MGAADCGSWDTIDLSADGESDRLGVPASRGPTEPRAPTRHAHAPPPCPTARGQPRDPRSRPRPRGDLTAPGGRGRGPCVALPACDRGDAGSGARPAGAWSSASRACARRSARGAFPGPGPGRGAAGRGPGSWATPFAVRPLDCPKASRSSPLKGLMS